MRKITLFLMSLFLTVGAMAQTFVQPETGKYYKIKGDSQTFPWLTAGTNASGSVAVSANESDAAVFEKTTNGFKAVSTGKYLGYIGGKFGYSDTEITVELVNTGSQTNSEGKYAIKSEGNWMYNNNTDGIVHESSVWLDIERFWGFIEQPISLSRTDWSVTASSEETSGDPGQATNAIDGDNSTFWHTVYAETYPHWIEFDMKKTYRIDSFDYVSRFDNTNTNGNILNYKLYVSNSAMEGNYDNATLAASGTFVYGQGVNHLINLTESVNGRYVALVAESGTCGNWAGNAAANAANCAEFNLYGVKMTNEEAKEALGEAIEQADALLAAITIGDGVGEYSGKYTDGDIVSVLGSVKNFYASINEDTPIETIEEYTEMIEEAIASYTLNMPVAGKYYTFKNDDYYITSGVTDGGRIALSQAKDASAIYYYDGTHLLAYTTGLYFGLDTNDWTFEAVGSNAISAISFVAAANGVLGKYNINSGDRWLHRTDAYVNRCTNNTCGNAHNWTIEEVESLPVTVTSAGYATFFAPVAVEATGVTAYTVTINGEWATLTAIEDGVIPANTGVVLQGEANTYNFAVTNTTATVDSDLTGTVAATYITDNAYVLTKNGNDVCFGIATKNQQSNTSWLNNSHKAYLFVAGSQNISFFGFRGEGTTAIENVEVVTEDVIFDLSGRRVSEITEKGVYIVNGRKVLVK